MLSQFTNKSQEKFDRSKLCHLKLSMAFNLYPVWLHMWMWYYDLSVSRSNSKEATTAGKNNNNSKVSHTNHTKEANEPMDQETHHHEKTETRPPASDYNQSPLDYSWYLCRGFYRLLMSLQLLLAVIASHTIHLHSHYYHHHHLLLLLLLCGEFIVTVSGLFSILVSANQLRHVQHNQTVINESKIASSWPCNVVFV